MYVGERERKELVAVFMYLGKRLLEDNEQQLRYHVLSTGVRSTGTWSETDENLTLCNPRISSHLDPNEPVIVRTARPRIIPRDHILIRVERFGFSANNVTYQALGEVPHFMYYDFHHVPTSGDVSSKTHGIIPVWGFGSVVESSHPHVRVGERVYGYFAPTRFLLLPVSRTDINKYAFYVPRPHLPEDRRPYNQILRCAFDNQYDPSPQSEDFTMLYRPLFWTSFWFEDWLFSSNYRGGAQYILISSASSKTAFCLVYLIRKRIARGEVTNTRVVGLTSKKNLAFTKCLELYDQVLEYDNFALSMAGAGGRIYVDVAGNENLNERIFTYFNSQADHMLFAAIQLGMTNLSASSANAASVNWTTNTFQIGSAPAPSSSATPGSFEQFFMPEWLAVRRRELSVAAISGMQMQAWSELMRDCGRWVSIERICGGDAVKDAYRQVVDGLGPEKGYIWSLWEPTSKL